MKKLAQAYAVMLTQIEHGREYPDAHSTVIVQYKLNDKQAAQLQAKYDRGDKS